jgi:cytochrome c553
MDSSHAACAAAAPGRARRAAWAAATLLVAGLAVLPCTGHAAAADLRPAYATPADILDGRQAALALCAHCHGSNGLATDARVPHIAGQRPSYLYAKARAYQTGTIANEAMAGAVRYVKDDALVRVAAYYASLEPANPVPAPPAGKLPPQRDAVAEGRAAAGACADCHGATGVSLMPGTPHLAGLDPKYFAAAMAAYRSGQRKHEMMAMFAQAASDAGLRNMALFYALQKPAAAGAPAAGDAVAGQAASAACAGCHGERGVSTNPATPGLAGQEAAYFVDAMRAYRDGARSDATMKTAAAGLDDATLANLARYYAAQVARPPKVARPLSIADWVQRCDRCHGANGNSTDPHTPAIAAQRVGYLQETLRAYQRGDRRNSGMAAMSGALTDAEVAALAHHYAAQKARSFVFVMLPSR